MPEKVAYELIHLFDWFQRIEELTAHGHGQYMSNALNMEAGDSLLMKIGESIKRISKTGFPAPNGVIWSEAISNRNWLIHQYDSIDRALTWHTLTKSIPELKVALTPSYELARLQIPEF
jgi:uncharacterized protein with HEPN domain